MCQFTSQMPQQLGLGWDEGRSQELIPNLPGSWLEPSSLNHHC